MSLYWLNVVCKNTLQSSFAWLWTLLYKWRDTSKTKQWQCCMCNLFIIINHKTIYLLYILISSLSTFSVIGVVGEVNVHIKDTNAYLQSYRHTYCPPRMKTVITYQQWSIKISFCYYGDSVMYYRSLSCSVVDKIEIQAIFCFPRTNIVYLAFVQNIFESDLSEVLYSSDINTAANLLVQ